MSIKHKETFNQVRNNARDMRAAVITPTMKENIFEKNESKMKNKKKVQNLRDKRDNIRSTLSQHTNNEANHNI